MSASAAAPNLDNQFGETPVDRINSAINLS